MQQVKVIDVIRNVDGIINQLPWAITLANANIQIGGGHRTHFETFQAYTR